MELSEKYKFVPLLISADINAGVDLDSINMSHFHSATFVLIFGADLSGDAILTLNSAVTDGAKTTAETFSYRYGSAATKSATADTLTDRATSAALTLTGTTFLSRMLICEIDSDSMTAEQPFLTGSLSAAASAGTCNAFAILTPRYPGHAVASAIPA
ncbi:MAG: hypothetical protein PF690_18705 [Deltaproteobacteria bacterium]|jgi:hypothetical protein|nr:hypothetical protein [Deltaproteobacteria bacterium]